MELNDRQSSCLLNIPQGGQIGRGLGDSGILLHVPGASRLPRMQTEMWARNEACREQVTVYTCLACPGNDLAIGDWGWGAVLMCLSSGLRQWRQSYVPENEAHRGKGTSRYCWACPRETRLIFEIFDAHHESNKVSESSWFEVYKTYKESPYFLFQWLRKLLFSSKFYGKSF